MTRHSDEQVSEAALSILREKFDAMTFEAMICDPVRAMQFCAKMRNHFGGMVKYGEWDDEPILKRCFNLRKQGWLAMEIRNGD